MKLVEASEFNHLSPLKCPCIVGLEKVKFFTVASNAREPVFVSRAAMAVLFSALGMLSSDVEASNAITADVVVFFWAKRPVVKKASARKRIVLFIVTCLVV